MGFQFGVDRGKATAAVFEGQAPQRGHSVRRHLQVSEVPGLAPTSIPH